jgi:hypothetical protein
MMLAGAAAPMLGGLAIKLLRSRKQTKAAASARSDDRPDAVPTTPIAAAEGEVSPPTSDRYDHRTQQARIGDAHEGAVIDQPIQPGAAEMQAEVAEAERRGTLAGDPIGPLDPGQK